jgi:hypothetical protein
MHLLHLFPIHTLHFSYSYIMLVIATMKIKICLNIYLFLAGLLQIVAISFLLQQCPQMVTLPQIVKSDMSFIFGWYCALFFLH